MTRYICDTARACDGQANKVKLLWPMWNMWEVLIFFFSTLEPAMDECQDPGQHDTSQTTLDDTSWTTSGVSLSCGRDHQSTLMYSCK